MSDSVRSRRGTARLSNRWIVVLAGCLGILIAHVARADIDYVPNCLRDSRDPCRKDRLTPDGTFVVYYRASAYGESTQVYLYDSTTQNVETVSVSNGGTEGDYNSWDPSVSDDGRFVAFYSEATNLVPGDINGKWDIFLRDRVLDQTSLVSRATGGAWGNGYSQDPVVSPSGDFILFMSSSTNLDPADVDSTYDLYIHDRINATTQLLLVAAGGGKSGVVQDVTFSPDERYVAFVSSNPDVILGGAHPSGTKQVFIHDRQTGVTERISEGAGGSEPDGPSRRPVFSANGRYVAFYSQASNLVATDANGDGGDVFLLDRQTGITELVASTDLTLTEMNSGRLSVSSDGRYVAHAAGLTDRQLGTTTAWSEFDGGCNEFVDGVISADVATITAYLDDSFLVIRNFSLSCGNGIVEPGEECDEDLCDEDSPCVAGCLLNVCGDGLRRPSTEVCDDGNLVDGDGCSSLCLREIAYTRVTVPQDLAPSFGFDYLASFGESVDIDGTTAVIGASVDDYGGAFVYVHDGQQWQQTARLYWDDSSPDVQFGYAVAVSGDTIAVTTSGQFVSGSSSADNVVYVYAYNGTTWEVQQKLFEGGADTVGKCIALEGDRLLVGETGDGPYTSPHVYVFDRVGSVWSQTGTLPLPSIYEVTGLAVDGDTAVVASQTGDGHFFDSVYVFWWDGASWTLQSTLSPQLLPSQSINGTTGSVTVEGDRILGTWDLHGTPGSQTGGRRVFSFKRTAGVWNYEGELKFSKHYHLSQFGDALALSGDLAVLRDTYTGDAQVFRWLGSEWYFEEIVSLPPYADRDPGDPSRPAVALDGNHLILGTNSAKGYEGSATAQDLMVCKNGILEGSEECEDGNLVNGDGCSRACMTEVKLDKAQTNCIKGLNKSAAKIMKASTKGIGNQIKECAKGSPSCPYFYFEPGIYGLDPRVESIDEGECASSPPPFGRSSAFHVTEASDYAPGDLAADVFVLPSNVRSKLDDPIVSKCQGGVWKKLGKLLNAFVKDFSKCTLTLIKGRNGPIPDSGVPLEDCLVSALTDPLGKGQKAAGKVHKLFAKLCSGVDGATAFPGKCASVSPTDDCLVSAAACRACLMVNRVDDLGVNCDLVDDGVANTSCVPGL